MAEDNVARTYYDTSDVDGFYAQAWGGENIHVGIYDDAHEAVAVAARRTVERMAAKAAGALGPGSTVLDLGSGYGGAARQLAETYGCRVTALNISEVQNRRNREINIARGLDSLIDVVTGSFHDVPAPDGTFDVVWSQDALCHSGDRPTALREAVRALKPGGHLVFTDFMAAEGAPTEELRPLTERLTVEEFATLGFYEEQLRTLPLADVAFEDLSDHLQTHYDRLTEEVLSPSPTLAASVNATYLDGLRRSLPQVAAACRKGLLVWGIFDAKRV
ncbi:methyltransferase domain-containing protein [Streptomyces sp. NPDC051173]|uniref:SAM-dependent methyltransferase n=2 Tax=unclassified Streptomyces TaxID=2593676 RepID=UPI00344FCFCB